MAPLPPVWAAGQGDPGHRCVTPATRALQSLGAGDSFLASMEKVIAAKTGNRRITFAQLRQRGFEPLLRTQEIDLMNSPANLARSVRIDDLGLKPTAFGITREQKLALIRQGEQSTRAFLERYAASHPAA